MKGATKQKDGPSVEGTASSSGNVAGGHVEPFEEEDEDSVVTRSESWDAGDAEAVRSGGAGPSKSKKSDADKTSTGVTGDTSAMEEGQQSEGGKGGSPRASRLSSMGKDLQRRTSRVLSTINTKMKGDGSGGPHARVVVPSVEEKEVAAANTTSTGFFSPPSFQLTQIIHDSKCFLPRTGHACVASGGDILIFGGVDQQRTVMNDFLRYLPGMNVFEPIKAQGDIPSARSCCTIVPWTATGSNREQLILFGGYDSSLQMSSTYKYDPPTRTWTAVQTLSRPPSRHGHVAVVSGNRVFVHGGYDGDAVLDDMWEFDGMNWVKVRYRSPRSAPATANPENYVMPGRTGHSACMWMHSRHKVPCFYFFGGDLTGTGSASNDLWIFTLSACRWNQIVDYAGNPPCPRFKHGSCVFDNHWMLVCGGLNHGWFTDYVLCDVHAYDMQANCWFAIDLHSMSSPVSVELSNLTVIQSTRAIYSFGAREEGNSSAVATSDVFRLSPLITYVSFSGLRHQVEALDEIVKMGTDSGEKALKITQMQAAIQKLTDEVTAIRRENDSLKRRMAEVERLVNSGSTEPKKGKRATPSTEADESDVRNGR